jgi:hypothetical protein
VLVLVLVLAGRRQRERKEESVRYASAASLLVDKGATAGTI